MENRLKMRISRMFRSSFGSCRTRNFSDVMEKAIFTPHNQPSFHLIEPMTPRVRPFPSIFRPSGFDTSESLDGRCFVSTKDSINARPCLPASPIYDDEVGFTEKVKISARNKKNMRKKKKKNNTQMKIKQRETTPFSYCTKDTDFGGTWWYSSDDEDYGDGDDETETLFSSKSTSSDSSRSRRQRHRPRRKKHDGGRVSSKNRSSEMRVLPLQGKVKDTFAVVKRSSDPYNDFRMSMVEMIVEKQIFAPRDLENLLQCFLSLNSHHHHKIIVEVFTEIYDALFSDCL